MENVLWIGGDRGFRAALTGTLRGEGYEVEEAATAERAEHMTGQKRYQLALVDLSSTEGGGAALRLCREKLPETPVVAIAAMADLHLALEAMKFGAAGYLRKPLSTPDEAKLCVRRVLDQRHRSDEAALLREELESRCAGGLFLTRDPKTLEIVQQARRAADNETPILITGESGCGKETLARFIHSHSRRATRAFACIDCGGSASLIATQLFGSEEGAANGSSNGGSHGRAGRLERAYGGTIFLREVANLDGPLQAQLLRVLATRAFERVGGRQTIRANVRFMAGTRRNLAESVAQRQFREELYSRLRGAAITVPPLRERPLDIPLLAEHFLERAANSLSRVTPRLSPEALDALAKHRWPGNVRELRNLMEHAAMVAGQVVTAADLPLPMSKPRGGLRLDQIERQIIEQALLENQNNRTRTAAQLGISLRTLQYRLKEYGLSGGPQAARAPHFAVPA